MFLSKKSLKSLTYSNECFKLLYKTNVYGVFMANTGDSLADSSSHKSVQERLLDTAEELFCEHGFDGTSVRDIASAADCNVASVNYYFGGKEKLYIEVWRRHLLMMRETSLASIERVMSENAERTYLDDLLKSFATAFLEPIKDKSKAHRLIKFMDHEMIEPHLPKNMFLEEMIMPTFNAMQNALVKIYPDLDQSNVPLLLFSIIGQLVHLIRVQTLFDQSYFLQLPGFDFDEAVNHIVKFSAAGIRAYAEGKTE